jgi:hypothetical protein
MSLEDLGDQADAWRPFRIREAHCGAGFQLLARVHQRVPETRADFLEQQALGTPATRIPPADQARRKDLRVIGDEEIPTREELRQVGYRTLLPLPTIPADHQEP